MFRRIALVVVVALVASAAAGQQPVTQVKKASMPKEFKKLTDLTKTQQAEVLSIGQTYLPKIEAAKAAIDNAKKAHTAMIDECYKAQLHILTPAQKAFLVGEAPPKAGDKK